MRYSDRYCTHNNFSYKNTDKQVIIQHSAMGTGKTYQVRDLLKEYSDQYPRVLVFSPRRIFAKNMTNDLN